MAYEPRWKNEETDQLIRSILTLQNEEEAYRFFDDVCTIKEIQAVAQRLHVAKLLTEKRTYVDIENATQASTATISRVNRSLSYGADGYAIVFERLGESEK